MTRYSRAMGLHPNDDGEEDEYTPNTEPDYEPEEPYCYERDIERAENDYERWLFRNG